jgi:hypothetical protein
MSSAALDIATSAPKGERDHARTLRAPRQGAFQRGQRNAQDLRLAAAGRDVGVEGLCDGDAFRQRKDVIARAEKFRELRHQR